MNIEFLMFSLHDENQFVMNLKHVVSFIIINKISGQQASRYQMPFISHE